MNRKILLVADVHLGVPNRNKDVMWALKVVKEYAMRNEIKNIFILGDLFHDRSALDIEALCLFHDYIEDCRKQDQTWTVFPGNHDMFLKHNWDINSLKPFSNQLSVIATVKAITVFGQRFWILPFIDSESNYMKVLNKIQEKGVENDILLTHIGVNNAVVNSCFLLQYWNAVNFNDVKFKQVYTGHFHTYQQIGNNTWYPGSLIPFKFDEGDSPHGFLEYDIDRGRHLFKNIWELGDQYFPDEVAPPQYMTLLDSCAENWDTETVKNAVVRVALSKDYVDKERKDLREHLVNIGAKSVQFLTTLLKDDIPKDKSISLAKFSTTKKAGELFKRYLDADTKGLTDLNPELLLELNKAVVEEGDEIYTNTMLTE